MKAAGDQEGRKSPRWRAACAAPGEASMVLGMDYQPAPDLGCCPPSSHPHGRRRLGSIFHHRELGGGGDGYVSSINMLENILYDPEIYLLLKRIFQPHLDLMGTARHPKARGIRVCQVQGCLQLILRNASQVNRP